MFVKKIYERNRIGKFKGSPFVESVVKLKGKKRTAIVVGDNIIFGNKRAKGGLVLEKPLQKFRYWNVDDVVMVKPSHLK
jgi:FAD synthase